MATVRTQPQNQTLLSENGPDLIKARHLGLSVRGRNPGEYPLGTVSEVGPLVKRSSGAVRGLLIDPANGLLLDGVGRNELVYVEFSPDMRAGGEEYPTVTPGSIVGFVKPGYPGQTERLECKGYIHLALEDAQRVVVRKGVEEICALLKSGSPKDVKDARFLAESVRELQSAFAGIDAAGRTTEIAYSLDRPIRDLLFEVRTKCDRSPAKDGVAR